jgi:undecaprenyl diphosphate synthase
MISKHLYTKDSPDPDLIIRTGGDMRISNFLIWQMSYAELYFTSTLWPEFDEKELDKALQDYASRSRRFGGQEAVVKP